MKKLSLIIACLLALTSCKASATIMHLDPPPPSKASIDLPVDLHKAVVESGDISKQIFDILIDGSLVPDMASLHDLFATYKDEKLDQQWTRLCIDLDQLKAQKPRMVVLTTSLATSEDNANKVKAENDQLRKVITTDNAEIGSLEEVVAKYKKEKEQDAANHIDFIRTVLGLLSAAGIAGGIALAVFGVYEAKPSMVIVGIAAFIIGITCGIISVWFHDILIAGMWLIGGTLLGAVIFLFVHYHKNLQGLIATTEDKADLVAHVVSKAAEGEKETIEHLANTAPHLLY